MCGDPCPCHGFMPSTPSPIQHRPPASEGIDRAPIERELDHLHRLASLGTVATLIAHEFNNLLTPILSYTQAALDHPGDAALNHKAVAKAHHAASRASAIAAAILDLARKGSVEDRVDASINEPVQPCSVLECASAALSCLARDLKSDGINLVMDVDPSLTVGVQSVVLEQIMLNLILNARRAMLGSGGAPSGGGRGQGTLTISARVHSQPPEPALSAVRASSTWNSEVRSDAAGWIAIDVRDTGPGIAVERLGSIFDEYVSGIDAGQRSRSAHGTSGAGLGLALCKRLVIGHGCQLSVCSQVFVGTVFTITIPQARPQPSHIAA